MRETGESFAGYRELLGTSAAELLEEGRAHPEYPEPVARTWDISLRAAEQQCPAARPLLELLAFLAPDALPREVLDADTADASRELARQARPQPRDRRTQPLQPDPRRRRQHRSSPPGTGRDARRA